MTTRARSPLPSTAAGTNLHAFAWLDWGLLLGVALIWGSSFLLIAIGLDAFSPGVVAMARLALGAATLAVFRRARTPIDREDWPRVAILGVVWMAVPLLLFPIAQQWISSSVSGMLNGAVPVSTAAWATILLRRPPGPRQLLGIAVGFAGVIAVSLPELADSSATALGAGLVLFSVALYGLATNLAVPLQQRYGALPVLLRAQVVSLFIVVPLGLVQLEGSTWDWGSALAMVPLGALGTGIAYVLMTTLAGRVGGPRASVAIYFVPLVAILLGVFVRGEGLAVIALVGCGLVIAGAWIASRSEARADARGDP